MRIIEFIRQPWPWYVAGPMISIIMLTMLIFGKRFGISSNLRTVCAILGAGKNCEYFDFNWKDQLWNLVFAIGLLLGGFLASNYLSTETTIGISEKTIAELKNFGIADPGSSIVPKKLFSWEALTSFKGLVMLILGGFFVGFGTRYAEGCTSGHAISGLSNLQPQSLMAVVGFFIGGLFTTYFVLPYLLTL